MRAGVKDILLKSFNKIEAFSLFHRFTRDRAAVFMLHHFCGPGEKDYRSLSADTLEYCLRYIVRHGYKTLPLSEFVSALDRKQSLHKTVVFTVDDGYRDFLQYGFPVFSRYGIPVAVFITTGFIDGTFSFWWDDIRQMVYQTEQTRIEVTVGGRHIRGDSATDQDKEALLHQIVEQTKKLPREEIGGVISDFARITGCGGIKERQDALSWTEINALAAEGVEFYPHTCTHPILSRCSDAQVRTEIFDSKETISTKLNAPANIFCYPNGRREDFDHRTINALISAGYIAAFTSEEGFDIAGGAPDMYQLHRYALSNDVTRFKQVISGLEALKTAVRPRKGHKGRGIK